MITIFATPKNFKGIFNIIQNNALNSWRALSPEIQIIIFGDSKGSEEAADEINGEYIPDVRSSPRGVPYLSDLFYQAEKISKYPILVFINADIILPENFLAPIPIIERRFKKFLMVGHRWNINLMDIVNFNDQKESEIFWKDAQKKSIKHACTGIDYFVFRKNSFTNLPDFAIGRPGFDNWILWNARRHFIPLIDVSNEVMALHQNHDYRVYTDPKLFPDPDTLSNKKLHQDRILNLLDTNYHLVNGKIEKKRSREFINRNLDKLPIIFPEISIPLKIYKKLYRKYLL